MERLVAQQTSFVNSSLLDVAGMRGYENVKIGGEIVFGEQRS